MSSIRAFLTFLFLSLFHLSILSQQDFALVDSIIIEGNRHTKDWVIKIELGFEEGDSIDLTDINTILEGAKLRILGTGLFNFSQLNISHYDPDSRKTNIKIIVEENWYIFPAPIFELADRNFSVWWQEQNKSLDRVNYGVRFSHYNLTGNKDPLKLKLQFGYTRKFELNYQYPYLAWDNKLGIGGSIFYSDQKEIGYITTGNKTQFAKAPDEPILLSRFRVGPELKYRPHVTQFHNLRFEFHHNKVNQYVVDSLNQNYFLQQRNGIRFFYIEYDFHLDKRLYRHYPREGFLFFLNAKKEGLGLFGEYDNLSVTAGIEKHSQPKDGLIISTRNKVKTNVTRQLVSFANNTGLGWNSDIVSGYDLYVMDGTDYIISMNAVKKQLFDNNLNTVRWMPRQFRKMNLTVFLRFNFDFAYVNERTYTDTNRLNNRWIYGYGPALDIIFFNNFLFSFEYSFNDIGEKGLYFNNSIAF